MSDNKPIYTTFTCSHDYIYEMVLDPKSKSTSFVSCDRNGNISTQIKEINLNDEIYLPLQKNIDTLQNNVVRFPSHPEDYINESALLNNIRDFIHKYLDISPEFEQIATYYVLFTWMYERFNDIPYLRALGDYGSGKSRFLQTIGSICYKPMFMGGASTSSPLFRIIDRFKGTLIVDEADLRFSDMTSDMVKILNTGYQKGAPLLRTETIKGVFEIRSFDVFCPKIIGTREKYKDAALESRFLVEEMGEGKLRDDIPRSLNEKYFQESLDLRNKLLKWRLDHYFQPLKIANDPVKGIHPRLQQITLPLFSIIENPEARNNLTKFITKYDKILLEQRDMSWESDIITAIFRLQKKCGNTSFTTKEITDEVNINQDTRDYLTPRKVGSCMRNKLHLRTERTRNGYILDILKNKSKLEMWKDRYGITCELVNDVNVAEDADFLDIPVIK